MNITKTDIEKYLVDVFKAINTGNYQISPRPKNQDIYIDYIFTDDTAKEIILSLTAYDFSEAVPNEHSRYPDEILYIFGKNVNLTPRFGAGEETVKLYIKFNKLENNYVFVISLHKQEYPLTYKFK